MTTRTRTPDTLSQPKPSAAANLRAVAYIRVSTSGQVDGHSLDAQERLFHELCRNRGWQPGRVYREEGKTATSDSLAKRPVFRQLMDDAAKGQFDVVVVHTLDRWSRNLKITLETVSALSQHGVGLVSITEQLDWSTPEGRLVARTVGSFSEFFSDMLAKHVRKGVDERARQGLHLGGIPFGFESCWREIKGEKLRRCQEEHPGGLHIHPQEGEAIKELFRRYASGTTTLAQLAAWLNDEGFRTRNTRKLPDAEGGLTGGGRLFTTASVRTILHNAFYTGKVKHHEALLPGAHEALVSLELFQAVEAALKKNNGRSQTLAQRPFREYLLKGLIRCAHCGYPMWAQTYYNGNRYYREEYGSRSAGRCVGKSRSLQCHIPDDQISRIMQAITLPAAWQERLLAKVQLQDEVKRVEKERREAEQRLKRLGQVYMDDLIPYEEYKRQKRQLEDKLASLIVPGLAAAQEAGKLLENLPQLWAEANLSERRRLLLTMLDAVYVDTVDEKAVVAIKPRPAFKPLFQLAATREDSGVVLVCDAQTIEQAFAPKPAQAAADGANENGPGEQFPEADNLDNDGLCFWWRRGRVELLRLTYLNAFLTVLVAA